MTEVNMNVATYLKFDGISNVLVDVKPTALASELLLAAEQAPPSSPAGQLNGKSQLDTSFNVHMTLGNALEQLQQQPAAGQQTPALGKCPIEQSERREDESCAAAHTHTMERFRRHLCESVQTGLFALSNWPGRASKPSA
jgi:hypothetical protein